MSPDVLFAIAGVFAIAVTLIAIASIPPKPDPYSRALAKH
jgi:hypothetical protein